MRWWMRFGMGWGVCGQLVNMVMLSTALSPTFAKHAGIPAFWIAVGLPPTIIVCLTLIGWALDRWQWCQRIDQQNRQRSVIWDRCFEQLDRIERRLEK